MKSPLVTEHPTRARISLVISFLLAVLAVGVFYIASPPSVQGVSTTIVISQVYGGGGNTGSTFKNDFIELFNRGTTTVSVAGWSVQYASATGTTWQVTSLSGSINPGQYYLVQEAQGAGGTTNLPTPDATGSIAMSATAGKVALVNSTTAQSGSCPTGGSIIDFVGYGSTANCFEGSGVAPTLTNTTADSRNSNGCTDTDNNASDFTSGAPNPRNTASATNACGGAGPTNPSGTGAASPNSVAAGGSSLLTVTVTPGSNPTSTGITVTGDLTMIGGSATQQFFDDGTHGDVTSGNNVFSFQATVALPTAPGVKSLPVSIADAQARTGSTSISLTVQSPPLAIHDIQGAGTTSPHTGETVTTTTSIVTGVKSNGFFIQEPDATVDANPNTSEGIFVFTSSAPPAAAARGNSVQVTGLVQEFIPSSDPNSPPATEIAGSPMVTLISTGNPLPAAITITAADTLVNDINNLERYEGMRVSVSSLTVVGPTQGNVSEANATSTSNGVFYGVITGVARPFRELGLQVPDPLPSGAPLTIPRFDANPERLRVDSDGQTGGTLIDVTAGATVTNLVGPLDYGFRTYTILPDPPPAPQPGFSGNVSATPVPDPLSTEFTIASFNMERFFDTTNDPVISDVALTVTAFNNRLNKASLAIRNIMKLPDVIGVEEMENLTTLQAVATKLNNDEVALSHPNPNYQAYLSEGNDIGGIDVGLLVKASRVSVMDVTQFGLMTTYINPNNGLPELLNDRPPLVMHATVNAPAGSESVAVTVIVNHLRSLSGIDDPADGNRVRTKRRAQAEFLANLIQGFQMMSPNERIISVGDYNAFQFNDGYVDSIGTVKGTPTAASGVTLASSDLVNPDLVDLIEQAPADQRYSFNFDGNAQALDHELVNPNMFSLFSRIAYARNDSDFPETFRNDANRPERISDHDMPVAYFTFPPASADLSLAKMASPNPVVTGGDITYTITVTNGGPDPAANVTVAEATPTGTTFKSISAPVGWSCITPSVGSTGTVTCMISSLGPGMASFTLVVTVDCTVADGTVISNEATVSSSTSDPDTNDLSATAMTTASNPAPVITCPANFTVNTDPGQCSAVVTYTVTATDNCPGATVMSSPPSGSSFPKGTTTVAATATDSAGRTATCSFAVTVVDNQPPTITCPANISANTATGLCSAIVTYTVTATDNCSAVTIVSNPPSGSSFPKGTTTVTATATDGAGLTASCSFTITVVDNQAPTITCPASRSALTLQPMDPSVAVTYPVPVASDNCPGVAVVCNPASGAAFPAGTTTVTCTATDTSGNSASCSFTVTVWDVSLQDNGSTLLLNTFTGQYVFCCSDGTRVSGIGTVTKRGCTITFQHFPPTWRAQASVNACAHIGTASLQSPPGQMKCSIVDRNTADNTSSCPAN